MSATAVIEKNCEACGDLMTVRLADHKRGWGRFCDKACAGAYKCHQRPRDVNADHAAHMPHGWAADKMRDFAAKYGGGKPPKARSIRAQVGKVKVAPVYHSPATCRKCGDKVNGPGLCASCEDDAADYDQGWDAHKQWGPEA